MPIYKQALQKALESTFEKVWESVICQTVVTDEQQYRIDLSQLKKRFLDNELSPDEKDHALDVILKRYCYLTVYAPDFPPMSDSDVKKQFDEIDPDEASHIQKTFNTNQSKYKELVESLNDKDIKDMIEKINYHVCFRTLRSERISRVFAKRVLFSIF